MKKILLLFTIYQNAMMHAPDYNAAYGQPTYGQPVYVSPYPQQQGDNLSPAGRIGHNNVDQINYNRQAQQYYNIYIHGIKSGMQSMFFLGSVLTLSTFAFVLSICGIIATVTANNNYDALLIAFKGQEHLILGTHTSLGKTIIVASSFCIVFSILITTIHLYGFYTIYINNNRLH